MSSELEKKLAALVSSGLSAQLLRSKKGIEKESLRVGVDGKLSRLPHPAHLGSALTHPYITTDYSEALLEFRTPPLVDIDEALAFLSDLHLFTHRVVHPEFIWPGSMPCFIEHDDDVVIAEYGRSNIGRMKYIYRQGLGYRYGRAMQAIAGVHFNYSLPDEFWTAYRDWSGDPRSERQFVDDTYFSLLRNFHRWGWLMSYLFGSSPAMCTSFARLRGGHYEQLSRDTVYCPYATSLRMSDTGYKNKNQAGLHISYDSVDDYVRSLTDAITTVSPEFARIGVKVNGEYRQLNANMLQIENEYYSFVRPKQIALAGERTTVALHERGVRYVEVRALDVNPFDPIGMQADQLRFVEAFLLLCLLEPNVSMTPADYAEAEHNQALVASGGRTPQLELVDLGRTRKLTEWAETLVSNVGRIADVLDRHLPQRHYYHSVQQQLEAVRHSDRLPSSRVLQELRDRGESYCAFSMRLAREHAMHFSTLQLSPKLEAEMTAAARESLQAQAELEAEDSVSLDDFLATYFGTSSTP